MNLRILVLLLALLPMIGNPPAFAQSFDGSQTPEATLPINESDFLAVWDKTYDGGLFNLGAANRRISTSVMRDWESRYPCVRVFNSETTPTIPAQSVASPGSYGRAILFEGREGDSTLIDDDYDWPRPYHGTQASGPNLATALIAPTPGLYSYTGQIQVELSGTLDAQEDQNFWYSLRAVVNKDSIGGHAPLDGILHTYDEGTRTLRLQGTERLIAGDRVFLIFQHGRNPVGTMIVTPTSGFLELRRIAD